MTDRTIATAQYSGLALGVIFAAGLWCGAEHRIAAPLYWHWLTAAGISANALMIGAAVAALVKGGRTNGR